MHAAVLEHRSVQELGEIMHSAVLERGEATWRQENYLISKA